MILTVKMGSHLDRKIDELWDRDSSWTDHISLLDPNITRVVFKPLASPEISYTNLYFNSEESMTWFILRWT